MRRRIPRFLPLLILVVAAALAAFFVVRARAEEPGQPLALCPGPDAYGYRCEENAAFAYIDATLDLQLYADDALFALPLPFPFLFYGTTYNELQISSNGNLQFSTDNPAYANECLNRAPAAGMGDMIAPFWDDLDSTVTGFIEVELVGDAPERILVIEWDGVPRFGAPDDTFTFEVQLFEGSSDIVFLYEDVAAQQGAQGSEATIGLQSENQGFALQYSCNQYAVNNGSIIHFPHPHSEDDAQNRQPAGLFNQLEIGGSEAVRLLSPPPVKGDLSRLLSALARGGAEALPALRAQWLAGRPARDAQWLWADLTADGRPELVYLWRGPAARPELAELVVVEAAGPDRWQPLFQSRFLARQEAGARPALDAAADLTGDGGQEVLLYDAAGGRLQVLSLAGDQPALYSVPGLCHGALALLDVDGDGQLEIVRDGCDRQKGRLFARWDGAGFVLDLATN